jgi:hypothetical protein
LGYRFPGIFHERATGNTLHNCQPVGFAHFGIGEHLNHSKPRITECCIARRRPQQAIAIDNFLGGLPSFSANVVSMVPLRQVICPTND